MKLLVMTERLATSSAIPFEFSVQLIDIAIVIMDRTYVASVMMVFLHILFLYLRDSPALSGQFPVSHSHRHAACWIPRIAFASPLRGPSPRFSIFGGFEKCSSGAYMYVTPSVFQPRTEIWGRLGTLETIRHRNVVDYIADLTSLDLLTGAAR